MEIHVDDMLVESLKAKDHVTDLETTFVVLHHYSMKMNPNKSAFTVASGKFLGFTVNKKGIEANLSKVQTIIDKESPKKGKDIKKLTRKW